MNDQSVPFSPIAVVGTLALLAAFLTAAWSFASGIAGNARKSRRLVNASVYGLYGFGASATIVPSTTTTYKATAMGVNGVTATATATISLLSVTLTATPAKA